MFSFLVHVLIGSDACDSLFYGETYIHSLPVWRIEGETEPETEIEIET